MLHPLRQRAIKLGITNMCEACEYSMYTLDKGESQYKFEYCSAPSKLIMIEKNDCSSFECDDSVLDEEERDYYEDKSIRWN